MINTATISEAFEFVRNGASIKQQDGASGIPITRIETIWNATIDQDRFGYANIEDIGEHKNHLLKEGDILMSHINSPKHLGKCAIFKSKPVTLIHGMNLLNLRPKKNVLEPHFAFYYLSSNGFRESITKISNQSVNQASFSTTSLKKLQIPLPPLAEQQKIAAILDAADSLRQKDQQLVERYTALSQSLFLEMFGDPETNSKGMDEKPFSEVLNLITYGLTVRPEYIESGIPLISAREIRTGKINFETAPKISKFDFEKLSDKAKPTNNDILFSKTGSIGHCALVQTKLDFAISQNAARLSFNNTVKPVYALNYLKTTYIQQLSQSRAKGNAVKDLQLGDMKKFKFIVPPITLQNQFTEIIQLIEAQKQQAQLSLAKSEALFNSLLQCAFTGELTAKMAA